MVKSKAKPYEHWKKNQQDPGIARNEKGNDSDRNREKAPGKSSRRENHPGKK